MAGLDFSCCLSWEGLVTITTPAEGPDVVTPAHDPDGRWHMWEPGVAKFWGTPENRGQSRLIPLANGRRSTRRRWDERKVRCPMSFVGIDPVDPAAVMRAAVDEFYDAVVVPLATGQRTLTVVSFDEGRARSGLVTIEDLAETEDPSGEPGRYIQDYELVVTIEGGRLPEITPP